LLVIGFLYIVIFFVFPSSVGHSLLDIGYSVKYKIVFSP